MPLIELRVTAGIGWKLNLCKDTVRVLKWRCLLLDCRFLKQLWPVLLVGLGVLQLGASSFGGFLSFVFSWSMSIFVIEICVDNLSKYTYLMWVLTRSLQQQVQSCSALLWLYHSNQLGFLHLSQIIWCNGRQHTPVNYYICVIFYIVDFGAKVSQAIFLKFFGTDF